MRSNSLTLPPSPLPPSVPPTEFLCREPHQRANSFNVSVETDDPNFKALRSVSYPGNLGLVEDGFHLGPPLRQQSSSYPDRPVATHGETTDGGGEGSPEGRRRGTMEEEEEVKSTGRGTFMANLKNAFVNRQARARAPPPPPAQNIPFRADPSIQFAESAGLGISYMKVSMTQFPGDQLATALEDMDGMEGVEEEEKEGEEEKGEGKEEREEGEGEREEGEEEEVFRSLLLFIPLRLGQEKFNPEYADALKASVRATNSHR